MTRTLFLLAALLAGCRTIEDGKVPIASATAVQDPKVVEARLKEIGVLRDPMQGAVVPVDPLRTGSEKLDVIDVVVKPGDRASRKALTPYYQDDEIIFGKRIKQDDGTVLYRFYRPVSKRAPKNGGKK